MNIWTKSLLIGLGVTVIYCGVGILKKSKTGIFFYTYHGHYLVHVQPKDTVLAESIKPIDKVTEILKSRIMGAYSQLELKKINDHLLDLSVSKIKDTNQIRRLITANSSLEFREMYTLKEASRYFSKTMNLFGYSNNPPVIPEEKKIDTTTTKDSAFVKFSDSDPSPVDVRKAPPEPLIIFSEPYQMENSVRFQPSIGMVKIKDTTAVNGVVQLQEFVNAIPADLKMLYGPIIERSGEKNKNYLYLYAVHAWPGQPALLNNDDITSARLDYTQTGIPEINFEFNAVAAGKWERMTTDNIGKPIAIILDNEVISAPNVNGTISGGNSSISGGFTVTEAQDLALLLNSSSMPATTSIIAHEITKERRPIIPGNPLLYILIFVVATGISYLIINLVKNN
jgi:SecD/SecF fusion protein